MLPLPPNSLESRLNLLQERWSGYCAAGDLNHFVEFAIALNSLAEQFNHLRLPGLVRICEGLENVALAYIGDAAAHPLCPADRSQLQRQFDTLLGAVASSRRQVSEERRVEPVEDGKPDLEWIKPRTVWIVAAMAAHPMAAGLVRQMQFFGFQVREIGPAMPLPDEEAPLAVLFLPDDRGEAAADLERIADVRRQCSASQLFYLGVPPAIDPIVGLMRAGIDVTVPVSDEPAQVLNRVLDLVQTYEQEKYRVLVVEDSRVATALIQRTLSEHGIDSTAIGDPGTLLEVLGAYRPDLILMDMHMPRFSGVEATRVLRQLSGYESIPIVYLSASSDIGMQVEALRLGGDQFLTKPFNPVLLAAVVKTKIERHREIRRSSRVDGLTGLLNHTSAKARLNSMWETAGAHGTLSVAMIDIDHFKSVNDTYGHPVGDQVIRSLAWLLRGRLRSCDLIGRYGGEEFLIAVAGASEDQTHALIDSIRRDFAELPHVHTSGTLYSTFSSGLAHASRHDGPGALTEAADQALLQAKRKGRNRVERG